VHFDTKIAIILDQQLAVWQNPSHPADPRAARELAGATRSR
jgi:hypothetical protein